MNNTNEEHIGNCSCDECAGACNNGEGGKCGECFACEGIAEDAKWWAVNRADILGL